MKASCDRCGRKVELLSMRLLWHPEDDEAEAVCVTCLSEEDRKFVSPAVRIAE